MAYSLIEARDSCFLSSAVVSGGIASTEVADSFSASGVNTIRIGVVAAADRADTFAIVGTAPGNNFDASADFAYRIRQPGVVRSFHFNDTSELGQFFSPDIVPSYDRGYYHSDQDHVSQPVIDTTVFYSGNGSMKFKVQGVPQGIYPTGDEYADRAGGWYSNFNADNDVRFGDNSTFFVQVQIKWSPEMLSNFYKSSGGGGIKFFDITTGDTSVSNGHDWFTSSSSQKLVTQTKDYSHVPMNYTYDRSGSTPPMYESTGDGDQWMQNGADTKPLDVRYLRDEFPLNDNADHVTQQSYSIPNAFEMVADQWVTFMVRVDLGPRRLWAAFGGYPAAYVSSNARVRLWMALENQAPKLVNDWTSGMVDTYSELDAGDATLSDVAYGSSGTSGQRKWGKLWIFPYLTACYKVQGGSAGPRQLADAYEWVDNAIVSMNPIPFPNGYHVDSQNATLQSNLGTNKWYQIGSYSATNPGGSDQDRIFEFGGFFPDLNRRRLIVHGGGHASSNYAGLNSFNMTTGLWSEIYPPTTDAQMTASNYESTRAVWLAGSDGGPYPRPVARHTEQSGVICGNEFILLGTIEGNNDFLNSSWNAIIAGGTSAQHVINVAKPPVARYNFLTGAWTFMSTLGLNDFVSAVVDPKSNKILVIGADNTGQNGLWLFDPQAGTSAPITFVFNGDSAILDDAPTNTADSSFHIFTNSTTVYFPPDDCFYNFSINGNNNTAHVHRITLNRTTPGSSTIRRLHEAGGGYGWPAWPGISANGVPRECSWAYDAKNSVIVGGIYGGQYRIFDPVGTGGHATMTAYTPTGSAGTEQSIVCQTMAYDPVDNCHYFIDRNTMKLYALRVA